MKDDYLWDGSGEPDPEIERLENVLSRYRYQPHSLSPAFAEKLIPRRAPLWPKFAVAAAIILMALAGIWVVKQQQSDARQKQFLAGGGQTEQTEQPPQQQPQQQPVPEKRETIATRPNKIAVNPKAPTGKGPAMAIVRKPARKTVPDEVKPFAPDSRQPASSNEVASIQPLMNPFLDAETARHIEQAQLLLRSFRNTSDTADLDADYEKRRSRALLSQNALLRRGAQAKGNMPVEDLLGSVEPFLLDIANLPDKPTVADVRSIKDRMQKKEIIATLQIYSAPTLSQAF